MINLLIFISISILITSIVGLIYAFNKNKVKKIWITFIILSALLTFFMSTARNEYEHSLNEHSKLDNTFIK